MVLSPASAETTAPTSACLVWGKVTLVNASSNIRNERCTGNSSSKVKCTKGSNEHTNKPNNKTRRLNRK